MDFLLPGLMMMTLLAAIIFAMWSQKRTEESLEGRQTQHSLLARDTPDPNFLPDPAITDPHNVSQRGSPASHATHAATPPQTAPRGAEYDQPETRRAPPVEKTHADATRPDKASAEAPPPAKPGLHTPSHETGAVAPPAGSADGGKTSKG